MAEKDEAAPAVKAPAVKAITVDDFRILLEIPAKTGGVLGTGTLSHKSGWDGGECEVVIQNGKIVVTKSRKLSIGGLDRALVETETRTSFAAGIFQNRDEPVEWHRDTFNPRLLMLLELFGVDLFTSEDSVLETP